MTVLHKPRRVTDDAFLDFVRSRRCCAPGCIYQNTDCHHVMSRGSGGSDHTAVPLCRVHHNEAHAIGKARFEEEYGIDLWAVSSRVLSQFLLNVQGRTDEFAAFGRRR